jgi:hypothetical protein
VEEVKWIAAAARVSGTPLNRKWVLAKKGGISRSFKNGHELNDAIFDQAISTTKDL